MRLQKLVAAMVMAGSLGTGYVSALGLGEVRLNSALNQPLDAEIELLQVRDLTRNEVLPNLAGNIDFKRAGLDRPVELSDLNFKTILRPDRTGYIHVTSEEVIQEPFLNFMLEIHWPSGRLLREYTMLLDPPAFSDQPGPGGPVKPATTRHYNPRVPEPSQQQNVNPFDRIVIPDGVRQNYQPVQPTHKSQPSSKPVQRVQPQTDSYKNTSDAYHVKSNDTLWSIARTIRPSSNQSIQQTMVAIQNKNPEAFIGGNINRLKKGQVLRVPTRSDVTSISFQNAVGEVARQNREWHARLEQLDASRRTSAEPSTGNGQSSGKLSIVGGSDSSGSGRDLGGGTAETDNSALQNELVMTREKLDQLTRENTELKSRLKDLDDQISTLKRLIELKDDQMTAIQQQPKAAAAPKPTPAPAPAQPVPEPVEQTGFMDFLFLNPFYLGLASLIPLGLVAALLVYRRRKQEEEEDEDEEDFDYEQIDPIELPDTDGGMVHEDLELDDDVLHIDEESDIDHTFDEQTTQQTEDAVSEADIYIAYGRFPQAAELLEKAIEGEPERADLRLKLLEVHAENNDLDNFRKAYAGVESLGDSGAIRQAEAYKTRFQDEDFASQEDSGSLNEVEDFDLEEATNDTDKELDDDHDSLGFELDEFDFDDDTDTPEPDTIESDDDLDFQLDDLDIADESTEEHSAATAEQDEGVLDFDDGLPDLESALEDDFDFLTDDDEAATKLDLARAYIDMGDKEGAQDILQEVIDSGTDEQKHEAEALLGQIS